MKIEHCIIFYLYFNVEILTRQSIYSIEWLVNLNTFWNKKVQYSSRVCTTLLPIVCASVGGHQISSAGDQGRGSSISDVQEVPGLGGIPCLMFWWTGDGEELNRKVQCMMSDGHIGTEMTCFRILCNIFWKTLLSCEQHLEIFHITSSSCIFLFGITYNCFFLFIVWIMADFPVLETFNRISPMKSGA